MTFPYREVELAWVLEHYRPGSYAQPWTWDDEQRWLDETPTCCEIPGHYQATLERYLASVGYVEQPICLGDDGRVWDGHHRVVAARRLGFPTIRIEVL